MLIAHKLFFPGGNVPVALRCPGCRQIGTFSPLQHISDILMDGKVLGQRKCPNLVCNTHVFCVYDASGKVLVSYPPQRIDFDPKDIPAGIVRTFEEAVSCFALDLHVAAAIMIRRTLEELCEDKRATGSNLKERITALQSSVILPPAFFQAMDDLRLLGNDAAHVEAKTYESVGKKELVIALDVTKAILKAVYQLEGLMAQLESLKTLGT